MQVIVVTSRGIILGYSLSKNLGQFDLSEDSHSKETSEKLLELSNKK